METTFIYILKCPVSGDVRYVGKANNPKKRFREHLRTEDRSASSHKKNWIRSLINQGLKPEMEILEEVSMDEWKERERYYIAKYREQYDLTNYKRGGDGLFKGNQTSFKKGLTSHNKGKGNKKKCEVCGKLFPCRPSRTKQNKCCSKECGKKYRQTHLNNGNFKKGSYPKHVGQINSGTSKAILQIDKETSNILKEYPSCAEACRQTGISACNINNNVCGRSKSAGGYIWKRRD